jgi:hypothetical protein
VRSTLVIKQTATKQALAIAQHSPVFNLGWRDPVHRLSRNPILLDHAPHLSANHSIF